MPSKAAKQQQIALLVWHNSPPETWLRRLSKFLSQSAGCLLLQSKATEQQEQIAELGRRVAALEMERAELASKNAMLQKLASVRGNSGIGTEAVSCPFVMGSC